MLAWYDIIGLFGVFLVLLAYFLLQAQRISEKDYSFSLLNLIGAVFILISLYFEPNLPSIVVELAWVLISIYGLYSVFRSKRSAQVLR